MVPTPESSSPLIIRSASPGLTFLKGSDRPPSSAAHPSPLPKSRFKGRCTGNPNQRVLETIDCRVLPRVANGPTANCLVCQPIIVQIGESSAIAWVYVGGGFQWWPCYNRGNKAQRTQAQIIPVTRHNYLHQPAKRAHMKASGQHRRGEALNSLRKRHTPTVLILDLGYIDQHDIPTIRSAVIE